MEKFINILKKWNIDISELQKNQFIRYYEMLVETNKVMNLTSITEFDEVLEKHYLDSIALGSVTDLTADLKIIDVGTGAGFPGIPLKIAFPNLKVQLVDSLNKRVNFLNDVIEILGLENISAMHGRAEDVGRMKEHREAYDICVSRAVANLATLSELCLPFVKVGGRFVSYKSGNIEEELQGSKKAIKILGGDKVDVSRFTLPNSEAGRTFVTINKAISTPSKYPRKPGIPGKKPIL